MARIAGVEIPGKKHVGVSLRYIYGIGPANGVKILKGPLTHKEDGDHYLYFEDPDGNVLELVASTLPNYPDGFLGTNRGTA